MLNWKVGLWSISKTNCKTSSIATQHNYCNASGRTLNRNMCEKLQKLWNASVDYREKPCPNGISVFLNAGGAWKVWNAACLYCTMCMPGLQAKVCAYASRVVLASPSLLANQKRDSASLLCGGQGSAGSQFGFRLEAEAGGKNTALAHGSRIIRMHTYWPDCTRAKFPVVACIVRLTTPTQTVGTTNASV